MKRIVRTLHASIATVLVTTGLANAQDLPKSQPKLITVWREAVKVGKSDAHAKSEARFVAAFEKAKYPDHYLALVSLTGSAEAWYITPHESHAKIAESMKLDENSPALMKELERIGADEDKYVDSLRIFQAMARPDLSAGDFPDLAKARFFSISIIQAKLGHEADFDAAAKAYGAARLRVAPKHGFRVYQVIAGMPSPTYLIISSIEDYAQFDDTTAAGLATVKAMTSEENAARLKFQTEGAVSMVSNRYRVDPGQSYVSQETRAKDPKFWSPK